MILQMGSELILVKQQPTFKERLKNYWNILMVYWKIVKNIIKIGMITALITNDLQKNSMISW